MEYILTIVGLVVVTLGADWVVSGSSAIAKRAGLSDFVIGLTIVAFGTSFPEMVVSFRSALQGSADIAIGNVVGSNIFNTAVILGLTALLSPVAITRRNRLFDVPVNMISTVLLLAFVLLGHRITLWDGLVLVVLFTVYFGLNFWLEKNNEPAPQSEAGTSLPELATSVVAAIKGRGQMALGNLVGSNIFNTLLILGGSAIIRPLKPLTVTSFDFVALGVITFLMLVATNITSNSKVSRIEGAVLLIAGIAYMVMSIIL